MPTLKARPPRIIARDTRAVRPPPPPAGGRGPKITVAFYGTAAWKTLMREIIAERGRQIRDHHALGHGWQGGRYLQAVP